MGQWFSARDGLAPEDTWQCLETHLIVQLGAGGATGIQRVELRDAAKDTTVHRRPHNKELISPYLMSIAPRLRTLDGGEWWKIRPELEHEGWAPNARLESLELIRYGTGQKAFLHCSTLPAGNSSGMNLRSVGTMIRDMRN